MSVATAAADGLTDEQRQFVAAIGDFCERETFAGDDPHQEEVAARMAELGWYGLQIDEEYGGSGGSFLDATLFLEETARGQAPVGAYGVTLIVTGALNRFGSEEQKRELLGRVARGGALAIAMSEPDAGSDVAALKTRARREDGEWVLDGAKMWCSYAHKASQVLIVCRTSESEDRHRGMSMVLVPRESEGFTITPIKTLGGEETNELHLDGVRVPEENLLGSEGNGWTQLMAGLNFERVILAATALGMAQRTFDDALAYAKERRQFGRPIGSFQAIKHILADVLLELESARAAAYFALLAAADDAPDLPAVASLAKAFCSDACLAATTQNIQVHGGIGFTWEHPAHLYLKRAKTAALMLGDPAYHRELLAQRIGL